MRVNGHLIGQQTNVVAGAEHGVEWAMQSSRSSPCYWLPRHCRSKVALGGMRKGGFHQGEVPCPFTSHAVNSRQTQSRACWPNPKIGRRPSPACSRVSAENLLVGT